MSTFDGIEVRFRKQIFHHCFYETTITKDDTFSWGRAERIDWIVDTLQNPNADLFVGWDSVKKRYATNRRVAMVNGDYVVVIRLKQSATAEFVTAYVASRSTIAKIRSGPRWK